MVGVTYKQALLRALKKNLFYTFTLILSYISLFLLLVVNKQLMFFFENVNKQLMLLLDFLLITITVPISSEMTL